MHRRGVTMDTITITAYSFEELSPEAQQKVIDKEREHRYSQETPWIDEYHDSLKAFCDAFQIEVGYHYEDVVIKKVQSNGYEDTITGLRLRTWLLNNVYELLYSRKRYWQKGQAYRGKHRVSRITMEQTGCPLTGFCGDEDLMRPIRDFIAKPITGIDMADLLGDCIYWWNKACSVEREYYMSDEAIREDLESRCVTVSWLDDSNCHTDIRYTKEGKQIDAIYIR